MDQDTAVFTAYLLLSAGPWLVLLICPHIARAVRGDAPARWRNGAGAARRIRIPFFTAAAIFLVLEAGVIVLLPCALAFRRAVEAGLGAFAAGSILLFSVLMAVSLAFACGSGAMDWES